MNTRYLMVDHPSGSFLYRRRNGHFERIPSSNIFDITKWELVRIVDLPLEVFGALFDAVTDILDLPMTTIYNVVCPWDQLPEELATLYRTAFAECTNHILSTNDIDRMWFVVPDSFVCKAILANSESSYKFNGLLANINAGNLRVGEECICTTSYPNQYCISYSPNLREVTCKHISLVSR